MSIVIRRSKIHAHGCYATQPISKGTRIVEYTGPRLTVKQADELYQDAPSTYLYGLSDGEHVIDGDNTAAFINHSCDPNCESDEIDGRVYILSIRDIRPGEELTYDYSLYDGELDDQAPCWCGAANCRGSMYSEEELAKREAQSKKKAARKKSSGGRKQS
ncbi:MAG: SET domain-containing protein-lysine N-methyltransferase [Acidobacteria bacterium]|nr:SET domain-containing protein-lysine N-methyltransferase [Acidobacteriota bacterium]